MLGLVLRLRLLAVRTLRHCLVLHKLVGVSLVGAWGCTPVHLATVHLSDDPAFVIENVSVFDAGAVTPGRDVLVRGGRVQRVGPTDQLELPSNLQRMPGEGRTVLPGLVEMHAHLLGNGGPPWSVHRPDPNASLRAFLYAGVTSVLVAQHADPPCHLVPTFEQIETAKLKPHLFPAGPGLTGPGGHPSPMTKALAPALARPCLPRIPFADNPQDARIEVRRVASRHRPPFYKIFNEAVSDGLLKPNGAPKLPPDALAAAASEAKVLGMRPIAHIATSQEMIDVINAGVELVMHPPYRDRLCPRQIEEIKRSRVPFVTTARLYSASVDLECGRATPLERAVVERGLFDAFRARPAKWENAVRSGFNLGAHERSFPDYRANMTENIKALVKAGVPFFVGTDTSLPGLLPGAALHAEIADLVGLGIDSATVLGAATTGAAKFLEGREAKVGRVAEGYRADLLIVDGNPVDDIGNLHRIYAVILGGRRLERSSP